MLVALGGAAVGAAVGYLVSRKLSLFTGGVCPLMCNPKLSVPYFAVLGLVAHHRA